MVPDSFFLHCLTCWQSSREQHRVGEHVDCLEGSQVPIDWMEMPAEEERMDERTNASRDDRRSRARNCSGCVSLRMCFSRGGVVIYTGVIIDRDYSRQELYSNPPDTTSFHFFVSALPPQD